jgi:hypothetical protein
LGKQDWFGFYGIEFRAKAPLLEHEGHFGNFWIWAKFRIQGVKIIDRGSNYKYWVSIGPKGPMRATKSTKSEFRQKPLNS